MERKLRTEKLETILVLIHGFLGYLYDYSRTIPSLPEWYHIIALDLIGFGFSTKNENLNYSKESLSEFIYLTLKGLGIKEFNILGYSMGGEVALNLVLTIQNL
jgi:pimeloyl-ACP methyl ester carboxylesterase